MEMIPGPCPPIQQRMSFPFLPFDVSARKEERFAFQG
jgi:hypothetical protein